MIDHPSESGSRARTVSVSINDARTLRAAYMPFLTNMGLFIPTTKEYAMGDEIFLVLKLIDDEQFALAGTVVWVTPADAQSSRTKGVGVQFKGPEGKRLQERVTMVLGDSDTQHGATHTL